MHSKLIARLLEVRQTVYGNVKVLSADFNIHILRTVPLSLFLKLHGIISLSVMLLNERNKLEYKYINSIKLYITVMLLTCFRAYVGE